MEMATVEGAGGAAKIDAEELDALKALVTEIRNDGGDMLLAQRKELENVLYCKWDGQSADGRKHESLLHKRVKPFDGASDNRVRLADRLAHLQTVEACTAARRAIPKFMGMEGTDAAAAGKWSILVRWLLRSYWGDAWRANLKRLARWMRTDTPAVAVMMIDWVQERRIEYREMDAEGLVDLYVEKAREREQEPTEEDAAQIIDMCMRPDRINELADFIGVLLPTLLEQGTDGTDESKNKSRAMKAARAMQKNGACELPVTYLAKDGPEVAALRMFEDIFVPPNTTDPNHARVILRREWLIEAVVRERAARLGWDKKFTAELLGDDGDRQNERQRRGYEGQSAFEVYANDYTNNDRKGHWEIITAYNLATNEDGVMSVYQRTFSWFCDRPATGRVPFERKHGKYPFVFFKFEELSDRLLDSRSIPERVCGDQASIKLLRDSFEDHVQINVNPPMKVPPGKPHYRIEYEPMGTVESSARENVEFMRTADYPAASDKYWEHVRRELADDWGTPHTNIDPTITAMLQQDRIDNFLSGIAEVLRMAVQLCMEYMPAEKLQRIIGGQGLEINRSRAEIQGMHDLVMAFDANDFDRDNVLGKAKAVLELVRPLDTRQRMNSDVIVQAVLEAVDPNWAELAIRPGGDADADESKEEQTNFLKMLNGIRPEMPEGGINGALRLQVLQGELAPRQQNPQAYPPLSMASQALIDERMKYLTFQAQQAQNATTGRTGVDTGKTDEEIAGAGVQEETGGMGEMGGMGNGLNGMNGMQGEPQMNVDERGAGGMGMMQ